VLIKAKIGGVKSAVKICDAAPMDANNPL